MRIVFESDTGQFGIECDGAIEYEGDSFASRAEAQAIASAHDNGAMTYEDAVVMVERLGSERLEREGARRAPGAQRCG